MTAPLRHPLTQSDISQMVDGLGKRQDVRQRAQALAAQHLAALDTIPLTTDNGCTLQEAKRLSARVRWLARHNDAGMLGPNGVAPAVASLVTAAQFHGFREVAK